MGTVRIEKGRRHLYEHKLRVCSVHGALAEILIRSEGIKD